jgi:archaellin
MSPSVIVAALHAGTNLYAPKSGNVAIETLVVALICLAFVAAVAAAATFTRRRETRREAAETGQAQQTLE